MVVHAEGDQLRVVEVVKSLLMHCAETEASHKSWVSQYQPSFPPAQNQPGAYYSSMRLIVL